MSELINHVDELIREVGPRRAGTRAENQAAQFVAQRLEQSGLSVREQGFNCSANIALSIVVELVLAVLAAYLLFFQPGLGVLALILAILSVALFALDLLDQNPLARLLSNNSSQNVIARYSPAESGPGERKRKVIVVAHYDAQQTAVQAAPFLIERLPILRLVLRVAIAAIAVIALLLLFPFPGILRTILASISLVCGVIALLSLLSVIINIFMPVSPGANCNGSGVAVLFGLAQRLTGAVQPTPRANRKREDRTQTSRSGTVIARGGRRERGQATRASQSGTADKRIGAGAVGIGSASSAISEGASAGYAAGAGMRVLTRECGPLDAEGELISETGRKATGKVMASKTVAMERTQDLDLPMQEQPGDNEDYTNEEMASDLLSAEKKPADFYSKSVGENLVNNPFIKVRPRTTITEEQEAELEEKRKRVQQYGGQATSDDGAPAWYTKAKEKAEAKHKDIDEQNVVRSQYADVPAPTYSRTDQEDVTEEHQLEDRESRAGSEDNTNISLTEAFDGGSTQAMPRVSGEPCTLDDVETTVRDAAPRDSRASMAKPIIQSDFSGIDKPAFQVLKDDASNAADIILPVQPAEVEGDEDTGAPERLKRFDRGQGAKQEQRDKLRDLPSLSEGFSERIPMQQAGLDTSAFNEGEGFKSESDSMVNLTGSFAPLGATGVMKPIGEELLEYNKEDEIYIQDADDSSITESYTESGSYAGPDRVSMPQSRFRSFFGDMGDRLSGSRKKREKLKDSPSKWLGVDEDYDARKTGSSIGSWDNFNDEDDNWSGGAYGARNHKENVQALMTLSEELLDKEVWLVGLGASGVDHAGMKAFLRANSSDLRGALIINVEGVGAGDLFFSVTEGTFRRANTDHRLQNIAKSAGTTLGVDIDPLVFNGFSTDATVALHAGARAISILGVQGRMPAGWRWSNDSTDILAEQNLQDTVELILEMIKNS